LFDPYANFNNIASYIKDDFNYLNNNYYTEVLDLYKPLYDAVVNRQHIWFGLNLIHPGQQGIEVPVTDDIKCYVLTFHGDPIDLLWISTQINRLRDLRPTFDLKNLIIVSNSDNIDFTTIKVNCPGVNSLTYFNIEHLHYLVHWYGDRNKHQFRLPEVKKHIWSYLSFRPMADRTLMACCLVDKPNGVFSMPIVPNFDDRELLTNVDKYNLHSQLELLKKSVPCPLDDYYEHHEDLKHAWSVNNLAFQDCLFNIVNESAVIPIDYMSEKSFKPFIAGCLPVFGSSSQINKLEKFGFKINRSLYQLSDKHPVIAQADIVNWLLALSETQLLELVNEHREHNRNWFFDGFYDVVTTLNKPNMDKLINFVKEVVD
jgi:hypothetical protein